jgi:hypothetical protein
MSASAARSPPRPPMRSITLADLAGGMIEVVLVRAEIDAQA